MAHDVFISYASADKPTADAVCATLEAHGIRCFIAPRDITPGVDWSAAIIDAIESGRLMVLVFLSNANASNQISREVERAVSKGLPIIPFRIEDVLPARNLEYFLGTPHWLDAMTPPLEAHLEYLTETVQFLLERGERPTPLPRPAPAPKTELPFTPVQLAAGGGGLLVAIVVLAYVLGVFGGGVAGGPGPVEDALVGAWKIDSALGQMGDGSTVDWTVSLLPDGRYSGNLTFKDAGQFIYQPEYGYAELRPTGAPSGTVRYPSWSVSGDTLMANDGAIVPSAMLTFLSGSGALAGNVVHTFLSSPEPWQRASKAQAGAPPWSGEWQRELAGSANSWRMKINVSADGKYTFEASIDDEGKFTTRDGGYMQVSENGGLQQGDYQVLDKDTIVFRNSSAMINPFAAQVTWKRIDK